MYNVARLIEKDGSYFCSNCLIRQNKIPSECDFCGCTFTNFEEIILKQNLLLEEEMRKIMNE